MHKEVISAFTFGSVVIQWKIIIVCYNIFITAYFWPNIYMSSVAMQGEIYCRKINFYTEILS